MNLGDFIQQKMSMKALPAPTQAALSLTLPSILSHYLAPDDTEHLIQAIGDYLRTDHFSTAVSKAVGEPTPDETEDEFVSRAKTAISQILSKRLNEVA